MSLRALQVEVIDLWLMHWPGPGYWTMSRSKVLLQQHGPWYFALGAPHRPEPVPGQTEQVRTQSTRAHCKPALFFRWLFNLTFLLPERTGNGGASR
jgi:hypothetical protein